MYIRKITQMMLWILGVLLVLTLIKGIENIMGSMNLSNDISNEESAMEEVYIPIVEGGEYDENDMFFEDFDKLYTYFNSIKEAIDCENVIKSSLISYGTPVRIWKVENILLDERILSFNISSNEDSNEAYEITISEKGTIIERIK